VVYFGHSFNPKVLGLPQGRLHSLPANGMQRAYLSLQRTLFSPNLAVQRAGIAGLLLLAALIIALFIGVVGPVLALAVAVGLIAGALMLADTHWGFVALAGVTFVLPFATLPVDIGFKPSFLDAALGALYFVWLFKLVIGRERTFIGSPIGAIVALFVLMAIFSFANGLVHSPANTFLLRRFGEIVLGISLFFVTINTVRTVPELQWVTRWLVLGGWACAGIAVLFYVMPEAATVWVLDRLVRFDYPGGYGALRYIEDDPEGTMRAIGTAIDPNVLGGMLILVGALLAPQLFARSRLFPRWFTLLMLGTGVLALYLTYSRSALLGLGAAIGLIALLRYRWLIPLAVVAAALLLLLPQTQEYVARLLAGFRGEDLATQMRFGEYKDALILIERYPIFGVGFTGVPDIDLYLGVSMLYLIVASNMGIVGLVLFVAALAGYFVLTGSEWRRGTDEQVEPILLGLMAAVAGVLVSGVFDHYWFNMSYPHMTVLLWLHIGLGTAAALINRSRHLEANT